MKTTLLITLVTLALVPLVTANLRIIEFVLQGTDRYVGVQSCPDMPVNPSLSSTAVYLLTCEANFPDVPSPTKICNRDQSPICTYSVCKVDEASGVTYTFSVTPSTSCSQHTFNQ